MIAAITATTAIGMPHPTKNDAPSATIAAVSAHGARRVSSAGAVPIDGCQSSSCRGSSAIGPVATTGSTLTGPVGSFA